MTNKVNEITRVSENYEVVKAGRNTGKACDWYDASNLTKVELENPTHPVGSRMWPAAYFVRMNVITKSEFFGLENYSMYVAGPFANEQDANEWVEVNS